MAQYDSPAINNVHVIVEMVLEVFQLLDHFAVCVVVEEVYCAILRIISIILPILCILMKTEHYDLLLHDCCIALHYF